MSAAAPRFSIVVPHYDGTIADASVVRCIESLKQQIFTDFEVLLYHDGPLSRPLPDLDLPGDRLRIAIGESRFNDWGHSLRDRGIREARGDYILHLNSDNLLYPNALKILDAAGRTPPQPAPEAGLAENPDILVFAILMRGWNYSGGHRFWRTPERPDRFLIYTGIPPVRGAIDCMQVVMRRSIWLEIGGWFDKSWDSDGAIYPNVIAERGARYVPAVLGEHW